MPAQHRLLRSLDPTDRCEEARAPERLAALLQDPVRLAAALDLLPGPALVMLELLTEIPDRPLSIEVARREVARRLGRPGAGAEAEAALIDRSLLLSYPRPNPSTPQQQILPWTLAFPLRPLLRGLALRIVDPAAVTITRPAADRESLRLAAAVMSGAFRREPPRMTQQGKIYARTRDQLAKVYYPGDAPPGARFDRAFALARTLGALTLGTEARGSREAWEAAARRTAADPLAAALTEVIEAIAWDVQLPLRDVVVRLRDGFLPVAHLASALAVQRHASPPAELNYLRYPPSAQQTDQLVAREVERLRTLPALALGHTGSGEEVLGLPPPGPGSAAGRAYVQPNLDLLLPPGTDPVLAFDAARIAEVRRVEAVVQLALTPRSVRQAREDDLDAAGILAILERVAPGAVPDNVRITVADWAAGPPPARLIHASVLHCPDPAAAERLRRGDVLPPGARELAPGVWVLPSLAVAAAQKALQAARIDVRPRIEVVGQAAGAPARIRFTEPKWDEMDEWEAEDHGDFEDEEPEGTTARETALRLDPVPGPDPALLARVRAARLPPPPPPRPEPQVTLRPPPGVRLDDARMLPLSGTLFEDVVRQRARTGQPLGIEVRQGDGTVARYEVQVERYAERRGIKFLEGRRLDTEEDVSVSLGQIRRMQVSGEERDLALDLAGLMPVRREQPKVGRNDPCPCGSGRKYKKCCGQKV